MEIKKNYPAGMHAYYNALLTRYARIILRHQGIASHIVMNVLQEQYEIDELIPATTLRNNLKEQTFKRCMNMKNVIDYFKQKYPEI